MYDCRNRQPPPLSGEHLGGAVPAVLPAASCGPPEGGGGGDKRRHSPGLPTLSPTHPKPPPRLGMKSKRTLTHQVSVHSSTPLLNSSSSSAQTHALPRLPLPCVSSHTFSHAIQCCQVAKL